MSRQIKFRVWDKAKRVFIPDDVYGITATDFGAFGVMLKDWGDYRQGEYFYENSQTLIQYTGLKDKHGKEIYESDIVRLPLYGNTIIVWNENICAFQYAYHAIGKGTGIGGRMTNTLYDHDSPKYEVIGNIYENENLLK